MLVLLRLERLMTDESKISAPTTCEDMSESTSSLELPDGITPSISPDGLDLFGQALAPASRSLSPILAARTAEQMKDICGRNFIASSESASLQSSLVSKLQAQSDGDGGTRLHWTLRLKHTPARRQYCEQTALVRFTKESAFIGWPTPMARDGKDITTGTAYLACRKRHSPSIATRWIERGGHWSLVTSIYCLTMGYPLQWNDARPRATATRLSRKSRQSS
jgi:hypothetical protein